MNVKTKHTYGRGIILNMKHVQTYEIILRWEEGGKARGTRGYQQVRRCWDNQAGGGRGAGYKRVPAGAQVLGERSEH